MGDHFDQDLGEHGADAWGGAQGSMVKEAIFDQLRGKGNEIAAGRRAFVGECHVGGGPKARQSPDFNSWRSLPSARRVHRIAARQPAGSRVGRGWELHTLSGREFDLRKLERMLRPAEHLAPAITGCRIAPDRLVGSA